MSLQPSVCLYLWHLTHIWQPFCTARSAIHWHESRESEERTGLTCRDFQRDDCGRPHEVRGAGHLVSQGGHRHGAPSPWRPCQGQPPLLGSQPSPTLLSALRSPGMKCKCCAALPNDHRRTSPRLHCAHTRHSLRTLPSPVVANIPNKFNRGASTPPSMQAVQDGLQALGSSVLLSTENMAFACPFKIDDACVS